MSVSIIARVEHGSDAMHTLTWLGSAFFSDLRLARFALDTWSQVGPPEHVDWLSAGPFTSPVVEVWSVQDQKGDILGAMTVHYYTWARMRAQRYFVQSCAEPVNAADCLYIQPFEGLVSERTGAGRGYDVAVELGYVAVQESMRGRGIGSRLFEVFLERAREVFLGQALAFTIVMARHAHSSCGQILMSHMIDVGANDPSRSVSLQDLAGPLGLPMDLLDLEPKSMPTARLALRQGFSMAGYGKNLGQVWIRDMQSVRPESRIHIPAQAQLAMPPGHLTGSMPVSIAMP